MCGRRQSDSDRAGTSLDERNVKLWGTNVGVRARWRIYHAIQIFLMGIPQFLCFWPPYHGDVPREYSHAEVINDHWKVNYRIPWIFMVSHWLLLDYLWDFYLRGAHRSHTARSPTVKGLLSYLEKKCLGGTCSFPLKLPFCR